MSLRFPKLIAFDLDFTLWDLWIDTHVTPPFHAVPGKLNEVRDKHNGIISFYRDVSTILHCLRDAEVTIAACSRTHTPTEARKALELLLVPPKRKGDTPVKAEDFFHHMEIYPGSKMTHFKQLHEKTGLPYSEMLFFDDERRNAEVERLGVTFCLVHGGLNSHAFERGLQLWRERQPYENDEVEVDE